MLVYKFGGGVLKDPDGVMRMVSIIQSGLSTNDNNGIVVVVSALGKMTNAFESLYRDWFSGSDYKQSYYSIIEFHKEFAEKLFDDKEFAENVINKSFAPLHNLLSDELPQDGFMAYDKIVIHGELISSKIISEYFKKSGIDHELLDARQLIITDSSFKEAKVSWDLTSGNINRRVIRGAVNTGVWLTQGFIASDIDGHSTTLGREGSDFTAAIMGSVLDAEEVVLWKDVPGIMTGDPDRFSDVYKLNNVSYLEAIELSYFGAKVLHPNTIKPLHNKNIPLIVKSIFSPEAEGTRVIMDPEISEEKPVLIVKSDQVLVSIQPRDFSFIMEDSVSAVFALLSKYKMRVNLLQHGAVSMSFCLDYDEILLNRLIGELIHDFKVLYNQGLELLTIRHYDESVIYKLLTGRKVYVKQQSRNTARFVIS